MRRPWSQLVAALIYICAAPAAVHAQPVEAGDQATVLAIRFEGNERTLEQVLRRELSFSEGDPLDPERVEAGRQALLDLELFEAVAAEVAPGPVGATVTFRVIERRYFVIVPRAGRGGSGDTTLGVRARWNNLFGRMHRMVLTASRKEYSSIIRDDEDRLTASYQIRRWGERNWTLTAGAALLRSEVLAHDAAGAVITRIDERTDQLQFNANRWTGVGRTQQGWRLGPGLTLRQRRSTATIGSLDRRPEITQVGAQLLTGYRDFHYFLWHEEGVRLDYLIEAGIPGLSDREYLTQEFRFTGSWRTGALEHATGYLELGWGQSRGGDDAYVVFPIGVPDLRAVLDGFNEGDSYRYLRFGFLQPLWHQAIRAEVFLDAGDYYLSSRDQRPDDRVAYGLGLRWRLRRFVQLELAFGMAQVAGTGTEFYVTTTIPGAG